ncbi:MAG: hypothetical protein P1U40_10660 [Coxiellaceae bacterium]|nr:hypothetical protein [Coxiellaceae bacterium]
MRKLILSSTAVALLVGTSTVALADTCNFSQTIPGVNLTPSAIAQLVQYPEEYGAVKNNKPVGPVPIKGGQCNAILDLLSGSGQNGSVALQQNLTSRFCPATKDNPTPTLTQSDYNQLALLNKNIEQLATTCRSYIYKTAAMANSGANSAPGYNPANPNSYSSSAVTDSQPHQPQPNIQWNTAPKQKSSQSITTDHPDRGNAPSANTPTPFNVAPKNNNNGGSNQQYKNSNQGSRFF